MLKEQGSHCVYCHQPLSERAATLDHVVPLAMGGTNLQSNLVVCCQSCNAARGAETRALAVIRDLRKGTPKLEEQEAYECVERMLLRRLRLEGLL